MTVLGFQATVRPELCRQLPVGSFEDERLMTVLAGRLPALQQGLFAVQLARALGHPEAGDGAIPGLGKESFLLYLWCRRVVV